MNPKLTLLILSALCPASLRSLKRACICALLLCASALNIFAAFTDTGTATVRSTEGSSGTVSGTNYVTTNGYGYAWFASGTGSRITGANATISTSGSFAHAIYAISGGEIDVTGVQVETSGYGTPVPLWFCPYDAEKSGRGLPHSKALRAPATLV